MTVVMHNWTRVKPGTFHSFHVSWSTHLAESLNNGVLPEGFYALSESHVGRKIADVLGLHKSDPEWSSGPAEPPGTTAVTEQLPRVSRRVLIPPYMKGQPRTLAIRSTEGHRIVAMIELVSPGNKASESNVGEFLAKLRAAFRSGIHVTVVDVLPPGRHDPAGLHAALMEDMGQEEYELPAGQSLTFASYDAGLSVAGYVEHIAVGDAVPDMPLFLATDRYVNIPLGASYAAAFRGMGAVWRNLGVFQGAAG